MTPDPNPDPASAANASPNATNAPVNEDTELEVIGADEAFFVQRDDAGELVPKTIPVPGTDGKAVRARPAPSGVYNEYLDPVEWDNDAKMAELFSKQYPDLDLDAEDVANGLLAFSARTMVNCIRKASGEDMQSALEEEQRREDIEDMMGMLGIDPEDADMEDLAGLMNAMGEIDVEDVEKLDEGGEGGGPNAPNA
jgi:hypothetical protein